jgi:hypothetical protein
MGRRIEREKRTIAAMIRLYCRQRHGLATPCADCRALLDYAHARLDKCRYGDGKTTCVNCPTHCYNRAMKERVREVMRYAGPRMLARHPVLALGHLLDGWKDRRNKVAPPPPDPPADPAAGSRSPDEGR